MAVYNLGSINIDHIFRLPHLLAPGETLLATDYFSCLGGKGANQSMALARGGARVLHIGLIADADLHFIAPLDQAGVDLQFIKADITETTGSAVVMVDTQTAENQIVINSGANQRISTEQIDQALASAQKGDWALAQNETNNVSYFMHKAREKGLNICYSAAPFVAQTTIELLPLTDLLIVNEIEAQALASNLNSGIDEIDVPHLVITLGSKGARYLGIEGDWTLPAPSVEAVDTTGAGDTFLGFLLAALTKGQSIREAMQTALVAGALQVGRKGTAEAIPTMDEVDEFKRQTL